MSKAEGFRKKDNPALIKKVLLRIRIENRR